MNNQPAVITNKITSKLTQIATKRGKSPQNQSFFYQAPCVYCGEGDIVLEDAQLVGANEFVQLKYGNRKICPLDHFGIFPSFNV